MNAAGLGYIVFDKSSSGVEGKGLLQNLSL